MIERVDDAALAKLAAGTCPDCDWIGFADGPRGGASQNIACPRCGAEFCVARFGGRVVMADRLRPFGEPDVERLRRVYGLRL